MSAKKVESFRYNTLALLIIEGRAPADIAEVMSISAKVVENYAKGIGPAGFNKVLQTYREQLGEAVVKRRMRFMEMQEPAYAQIKSALTAQDQRLATETAWRIVDEVAPKPIEATGGINASISFTQNNQVNMQLLELSKDLVGAFKTLKKTKAPDFAKHVKTGTDALPSAMKAVADSEDENSTAIEVEVIDPDDMDFDPTPPSFSDRFNS